MPTHKHAHALPGGSAQEFDQAVPCGQRSMNYVQLIEDSREKPEALRQNIIGGSREMWEVYMETEREFHPLEKEAAQNFA